ncbi:hypothetical protein CRG98_037447 [Punica granatum]|uniref:Uncharacterized protein n=1 Tax=Punica granatum TaxID=22663 RepID=A0A2I0IEF0_PUNGR|nr:hypothetical protein CRG98_037447 [Punica granatum]
MSPALVTSVTEPTSVRHRARPCMSPALVTSVTEHASVRPPVISATSARHQRHQRPSPASVTTVTSATSVHHQRPSPASPALVTVPANTRHRARRPSPRLTVFVHVHPCIRILFQGFHRVTRLSNTFPTLSSYPEASMSEKGLDRRKEDYPDPGMAS